MSYLEADEFLARIRDFKERATVRRPKLTYRPPTVDDFAVDRQILTFDQTLSNCGWALLNSENGELSVPDCGVITQPKVGDVRGFERTFIKSVTIGKGVGDLIQAKYGDFDSVVHEMPAIHGYRTESSLVAAVTIHIALDRAGCFPPIMISRNRAAAILCGDPHAPKKVSTELVDSLIAGRRPQRPPWNEHVRDAVFVGLQYLYDLKQESGVE